MTGITLPLAVLAGVVSFASPCCLPMVPVFVSYMVGATPEDSPHARRVAFSQALVFVLGFSAVFVALWASIGLIGYVLGDYRDVLRTVGGAVLIVMGLHVAGLIEISALYREVRVPVRAAGGPSASEPSPAAITPSYRRSALMGVAFGAGWTPCIGPILGGIIGLASVTDSVGQGTALLVAYALGLGIPFILVAIGATEVSRRLGWLRRHHTAVSIVSGVLLILTGFLMITNMFGKLSGLAPNFGL
ncbi:cytochrome c biogenesis protein CcdA [Micromonospora sonneratiae]|uniref:Cytochrome c biogenesis CcdA family protein n=1 Tax=Micromonospora sonneratiae TaxID=1184706 RepID=A0ABW3YB42_9ACTN